MRTELVFYAGTAGAWLGLAFGGWQLLRHNQAGATQGLLLSAAFIALLLLRNSRVIGDIWWSALSGVALLAVIGVLLTR
ncbi:hypothetical protein HH110_06385 [Stenotrophomonas sp. SAM-B]|uniref:hypothetical protein n=1 Tax=Stenotrophomonas sp. SAM-B TaxID=2729141 RepID=UPI0015A2988D|nr:hypothetical protein [Stenotrophomonas sp. SAM-B]NWF32669.1 hypothetical protein [Stenotrophomonas sp. SAM-B]